MKRVILNIKNSKYDFFMELVKNLDFIQVQEMDQDSKKEIISNVSKGFKELNQYKKGNLQATPAQEFLDEL